MRSFKWIEWNLQKIDAHGHSAEDVEAAFDHVIILRERSDGSCQMFAVTPAGRRVWVVWREGNGLPDIFGEMPATPIFVITAY